jgi:hypothetical protein
MPLPNLEDRVRELCGLAVTAKTEAKLLPILLQLQSAIQDQKHRLRLIAAEEVLKSERDQPGGGALGT